VLSSNSTLIFFIIFDYIHLIEIILSSISNYHLVLIITKLFFLMYKYMKENNKGRGTYSQY